MNDPGRARRWREQAQQHVGVDGRSQRGELLEDLAVLAASGPIGTRPGLGRRAAVIRAVGRAGFPARGTAIRTERLILHGREAT